jgi:hypothetical protein
VGARAGQLNGLPPAGRFGQSEENEMKNVIGLIAAGVALMLPLAADPADAHASSGCGIGSHITHNRAGDAAWFGHVRPMRGMNCASARYVMNKWLRKTFARRYSHRLPTHFWDGYVTWSCWKRSYYRWQCDEFDSGTSFRFTAKGYY